MYNMETIQTIPLQLPIQTISLTGGNTHILAPLRYCLLTLFLFSWIKFCWKAAINSKERHSLSLVFCNLHYEKYRSKQNNFCKNFADQSESWKCKNTNFHFLLQGWQSNCGRFSRHPGISTTAVEDEKNAFPCPWRNICQLIVNSVPLTCSL